MKKRLHEKLLFGHPVLYKLKRFIIEDLIWNLILCRIFRIKTNPVPDISAIFADRRVLVAACGPCDSTVGPPIVGASQVTAFDFSHTFATRCAMKKKDWNVYPVRKYPVACHRVIPIFTNTGFNTPCEFSNGIYCGDVCNMPHRDNEFDISVIYVSLHHIPVDVQKILGEMARVTRRQIIITECLLPARGLLRWMLRIWYRITGGGYHYYTFDELNDVFSALGIQVRSSYTFSPINHMWLGVLDCHPNGNTCGKSI